MRKCTGYKYPLPEKEPTAIEWAMLAAYIDGEGCIRITDKKSKAQKPKYRSYCALQVNVSNTDPRLPQWLKDTFGGAVYVRRHKNTEKPWADCLSWIVSSKTAKWVLEGCLPYFIIKRDQAEVALAFQATVRHWGGTKFTPPDVVEKQFEYKDILSNLKGRASRKAGFKERNRQMEQVPIPEGLLVH